jgi:hypothetical protein
MFCLIFLTWRVSTLGGKAKSLLHSYSNSTGIMMENTSPGISPTSLNVDGSKKVRSDRGHRSRACAMCMQSHNYIHGHWLGLEPAHNNWALNKGEFNSNHLI